MVRAEIIAIGSELLLGGVADTNSLYLADELLKVGIQVRYKTVVGDDTKDIEAARQHAVGRADVVIATGGLGPTQDDLTRKAVARTTGRRLVLHDETLQRITQRLTARRRRMTSEQATQALVPKGAQVIPNPVGTAPGFFLRLKHEGKTERALMCLPGVAVEVKHIFSEGGSALLATFVGAAARGTLLRRRLRTFGLVESELDARLRDLYTAERNAVLGLQAGVSREASPTTAPRREPASGQGTREANDGGGRGPGAERGRSRSRGDGHRRTDGRDEGETGGPGVSGPGRQEDGGPAVPSVQRRSGRDPVPRLPGGAGPLETVPIREGNRIAFIFSLRTVSNVSNSVSVQKEKMLLHGLRKRSINGNIHVTIGDGGDSDSRISRCRGPFSLWRLVRRPQRASGGEERGGAGPNGPREPVGSVRGRVRRGRAGKRP